MTGYINYPKSVGIKDISCTGVNPLQCVVCEIRPRRNNGRMTCGDKECVSIFFRKCVVSDVSERRGLK